MQPLTNKVNYALRRGLIRDPLDPMSILMDTTDGGRALGLGRRGGTGVGEMDIAPVSPVSPVSHVSLHTSSPCTNPASSDSSRVDATTTTLWGQTEEDERYTYVSLFEAIDSSRLQMAMTKELPLGHMTTVKAQ
jgi:hypothetical protein